MKREIVRDRHREYTLRGSETRTLATVGARRVVASRDLRDHHDRPADPRSGDLRHLREQGLIETIRPPVPGTLRCLMRFTLTLPAEEVLTSPDRDVVMAPDGRHLVYQEGSTGASSQSIRTRDLVNRTYVRRI